MGSLLDPYIKAVNKATKSARRNLVKDQKKRLRKSRERFSLYLLVGVFIVMLGHCGLKMHAYDWDWRCAVADCRVTKDACGNYTVEQGHD